MILEEVRLSVFPYPLGISTLILVSVYILTCLGILSAFVRSLACQDIIPNNSQQVAEKITLDRLPRVKIAREQKINNDNNKTK